MNDKIEFNKLTIYNNPWGDAIFTDTKNNINFCISIFNEGEPVLETKGIERRARGESCIVFSDSGKNEFDISLILDMEVNSIPLRGRMREKGARKKFHSKHHFFHGALLQLGNDGTFFGVSGWVGDNEKKVLKNGDIVNDFVINSFKMLLEKAENIIFSEDFI